MKQPNATTAHAPAPSHFVRRLVLTLLGALVLLFLANTLATPAALATNPIVVNDLGDDTTGGNGKCTLREALINANTNSDTTGGDCATGNSGADTLTFTVSGTITLGSTLPAIDDDVTIDGTGKIITVSGNNTVRVMLVNAGKTVTVSGLTVANGKCSGCNGGGIFNSGTLKVINSTFSANANSSIVTGGAGTLAVTHSTFSGNSAILGAGIYSLGTATVTDSTFSGNSVNDWGGGIANFGGTVNVTNSTFSGNSAIDGAGIMNAGTLKVTNSTFSENSASDRGGGIYNGSGTLTATNSTFSDNGAPAGGGGVYNYTNGATTLKNSVVANSTAGGNCSGTIADGGHNLQFGGIPADSCGATIPIGDPKLALLANYGGPTKTMALQSGSAAVDAGDNSICAAAPVNNLDQRGVARPVGANCDIGAYEYNPLDPPPPANTQNGPNYVVNTAADTNDSSCDILGQGTGNRDCTLREAIHAANNHGGADAVTFSMSGTITLGSTLPAIDDDVTIDGRGRSITVSGNNTVCILHVNSSKTVTVLNLTVSGANAGSASIGCGIYNDGTLTVTNTTVSGNSGGAGAGIYNDSHGTLSVTNSTFSGNSAAGAGGALYNKGTLNVTNSTFYNNTALDGAGAIHDGSGAVTVTNSTISGNSGNKASGLYAGSGTITLKNTIVANPLSGANCYLAYGTIVDGGHNLQFGGIPANSCGATIPTSDPKLGALGNNGGPTQTIPLQSGSAAVDAGDNSICAAAPVNNLDQRGYARLFAASSICDIGAYEYNSPGPPPPANTQNGPNYVVNTAADTDDSSCDILGQGTGNRDCTLREAVNAANNHGGADTITFNANGMITLGSMLPTIKDALTIDGSGLSIVVNGNNTVRVLAVAPDKTLALRHIEVFGGSTATNGGGIHNSGILTVTDCTFRYNRAIDGGGGGIYNTGTLTVANTTFSGNSAAGGGAIVNTAALTVTNSLFSGNNGGSGGGIYTIGDPYNAQPVFVSNSTFSGNSAGGGGGIYNDLNGGLTVENSAFTGNSAVVGGGIYNEGTLYVVTSPFSTNRAGRGGGIYNKSWLDVIMSAFSGNQALEDGSGGDRGSGGGIYNYLSVTLRVTASTFSNNSAFGRGGGIYDYSSTLILTSSTFSNNTAGFDGAGIYHYQNTLSVTNSTFFGNGAKTGGGIYNESGALNVTNSTFSGNSADGTAGAIYSLGGGASSLKNTIVANSTASGNCFATIADGGHNLQFGGTAPGSCGATIPTSDPKLGALGDNGGQTQTIPLQSGSAAIDAGDNAICAAAPVSNRDQRGKPRPVDSDGNGSAICDIGAYEAGRTFKLNLPSIAR